MRKTAARTTSAHPVTWLVLCDTDDADGLWAAERLARLGNRPVRVLTSRDLSTAYDWTHRIGSSGSHVTFTTASGARFVSSGFQGTVNRLRRVPALPALTRAVPADRSYALAEWSAFFLGWLRSLPGPVLNPPDPRGLCGAERDPREWRTLARAAGLVTGPASLPPYEERTDVIAIGDRVVPCSPQAPPLARETVDACLRLAAAARTPLLGITLTSADAAILAATVRPGLRPGGPAAVGALARALSRRP
jgi:hypothetical protein